ncbi:MAG TPA: Xaa-Pro peptidase family protein [Xanthobacteraceae bacterium]|nr:Xaa-Pro peptidase family protein [Xanthobacteraceae bacterium]
MRATEAPFHHDEYAARLRAVRTRMAGAEIDLLIVTAPENICYLSGYESVGYFVQQALIVAAADPILVVRALELPNAEASCVFERIIGYHDHEGGSAAIARAVNEAGGGRRVGVELRSRSLTNTQFAELRDLLPKPAYVDSFGVVEGARLVKSDAELTCIRRAGKIVESGMRACLSTLGSGRSEREVASAAYQATIGAGSDWTGAPAFVSSGSRSARAHTTWSDRRLGPGDPVFLEINAAVHRYHAAMMRPACIAPVPQRFRSMMDASRAGLEAALATIRGGATAADVDRACRAAIGASGWGETFRLRSGYSMGLGFENFGEGPLFSLHQNNDAVLAAGMVLHIVPYLAEGGFAGGAFSETVIVTADGCEPVCSIPRDIAVAS